MREVGDTRPAPLLITVERGGAGTFDVHLAGDLDCCTALQLHGEIARQISQQPALLRIDLTNVGFLDAAGIRALLKCRESATKADCRLLLINPQPLVHQVLQIAGLLNVFGLTAPPELAWRPSAGRGRSGPLPPMTVAQTIDVARARLAEARATRRWSLAVSADTRRVLGLPPRSGTSRS